MLGRPLAGIWNLKQPVILWSTKALIWRCSQETKWGGGGICRQISDKNCCLYPGEARRRVPRFLQDFPNLVPAVWLPLPSFGSTELPGRSSRDAQGCSILTLLRLGCKPRRPHASLCCRLTQMCFIWKWGQMAWIHLFLPRKQKTKPQTGCARRGSTLCPGLDIHTSTAQSCRVLPDGDYGNFKEKKKIQIPFCEVGGCTFKFAFGRATDLICLKYTT